MTSIERLNEILERLNKLNEETSKQPFFSAPSPFAILEELAAFMKELPGITQQLETAIIEQEDEQKKATQFYNYFKELYGTGLEVANWHQNGDTEPFDNFFDEAESE